ncbi:hypothetical protein IFM89_006151 [Coptis chinensis]|uniref:PI4-kinase N-terminal domain-containing protein n=1 Tax=Coptis chinensis TaxID=261450 RepID=A0A835GXE2_9MAGN|nr:hypothetical protein IFM89_006151 [Coptis chinensis]
MGFSILNGDQPKTKLLILSSISSPKCLIFLQNLNSHLNCRNRVAFKFVIGGNKVILSASNPETKVDDAEFEENEAYVVDIVTSTGDGKVVSSVKWLEDELELNALHNPGSHRGSGNEKAALVQRSALCAALGGQVEVGAMSAIAAFLERICFSSNGGILNGDMEFTASRSPFSRVFEYLKTPNLLPAVLQGLIAIIHRSFEAAMSWLILFRSHGWTKKGKISVEDIRDVRFHKVENGFRKSLLSSMSDPRVYVGCDT